MRYAIFSDIHGNLEALETVLADIESEQVDEVYCLGDIVGYYPNPNECVSLVKKYTQKTVAGNHDYAALKRVDIHNAFTYYACVAMEWTQKNLAKESNKYLASLPLKAHINSKVLLTHSTPSRPENWEYLFLDSDELVVDAFSCFKESICFNAHTHFPVIMTLKDDRVILHRSTRVQLDQENQYLINVGSVGQPRDGDPRSCYAIYDSKKHDIHFKRVKYDYRITQKKIQDYDLPAFLALRLEQGR